MYAAKKSAWPRTPTSTLRTFIAKNANKFTSKTRGQHVLKKEIRILLATPPKANRENPPGRHNRPRGLSRKGTRTHNPNGVQGLAANYDSTEQKIESEGRKAPTFSPSGRAYPKSTHPRPPARPDGELNHPYTTATHHTGGGPGYHMHSALTSRPIILLMWYVPSRHLETFS